MALKARSESRSIQLAEALKRFRDASRASEIIPDVDKRVGKYAGYGIVRRSLEIFRGIDNTFIGAAVSFGWIKRARPLSGGHPGLYWSGPLKDFPGDQLVELINLQRKVYQVVKKKKPEQSETKPCSDPAEEAAPDTEKAAKVVKPGEKKTSVGASNGSVIEVIGIAERPEEEKQLLRVYRAVTDLGDEPGDNLKKAMADRELLPTSSDFRKYSFRFDQGTELVFDRDEFLRLLEAHKDVSQIVIRVRKSTVN